MKVIMSLMFALTLCVISGASIVAQNRSEALPKLEAQAETAGEVKDFSSLVQSVFAPITDELNLTKEQQFQIIAIITGEEVLADQLKQNFNEVDQQLANVAFNNSYDEARVRELSSQEAQILAELVLMKVHAKARIYQILTPTQKEFVSTHFQGKKSPGELNLTDSKSY